MSEKIIITALFLLCIFAVVQIIRIISLKLFCSQSGNIVTVIKIDGNTTDAEYLLRSAIIRLRWLGVRNCSVLAVDCGADDETKMTCRIMAASYPEIRFLEKKDFIESF